MDHIELLISKRISNISSEEENKELEEIFRSNPDLLKHYQDKKALIEAEFGPEGTPTDVQSGIRRIHRHMDQTRFKKRTKILYFGLTAAAAVSAIILTVATFKLTTVDQSTSIAGSNNAVQLTLPNGEELALVDSAANTNNSLGVRLSTKPKEATILPSTGSAGNAHLAVPVGKDYTITLPDGSVVNLNSQSDLEFPLKFDGMTREISIKGEGFITVAANATKPFIVHYPGGTVNVLGTAFNINTYLPGTTRISLTSGKVKINGLKEITLTAGKELVASENAWTVSPFDSSQVLSWRSGVIFMENASLKEIAATLPRWFNVQVVIDNPETGNKHFAVDLDKNKPIEDFLKNLKETSALDYYFDGHTIHFR